MRVRPPILIANLVLAAVFTLFAWMQRNDIDPAIYDRPSALDAALWLLFYLMIAVALVTVCFRRIPRWLLIAASLACLTEMARTAPGLYQNLFGNKGFDITQVSMSAEDPRVELSREFFGAMIALAAVGWIAWQDRRRRAG